MRTIAIVAVAIACSSCGDCRDKSTLAEGFEISRIEDGRGLAVTTPHGAAVVHIDRYPSAPGGPIIGTAVLVFDRAIQPQTLEALDPDGDGHWDSVRYMAKKDGVLVWVEDNNADGVVDSTTPVPNPSDPIVIHE
jgi:hypothetical protein